MTAGELQARLDAAGIKGVAMADGTFMREVSSIRYWDSDEMDWREHPVLTGPHRWPQPTDMFAGWQPGSRYKTQSGRLTRSFPRHPKVPTRSACERFMRAVDKWIVTESAAEVAADPSAFPPHIIFAMRGVAGRPTPFETESALVVARDWTVINKQKNGVTA